MGSSDGFYKSNGRNLPRSGLSSTNGGNGRGHAKAEHVTVAAVDESYSTKLRNLTYLTIVCSIPNGASGKGFPKPEAALKEPAAHGLLVANMMLPPWETGYQRTNFWIRGVWYGLAFANAELKSEGKPPIDVAFIDGDEPGDFRAFEGADARIGIQFASKHGTRHYEQSMDPFGVRLLTLADAVVGLVRQKVDEGGNLESITRRLAEERQLYITLAPALPGHNGTGRVPV